MDELHQAHSRCLDLIEGSVAACSRQTHSLNKMYTCFSHVSPCSKARLPKLRAGKNSTLGVHSQGQTVVEQEQAARTVQEGGAPMTGRDDRGRVAKAEPFSSSTCMRLSILVLCTTSSGISAPSICSSTLLSSAPKAALVRAKLFARVIHRKLQESGDRKGEGTLCITEE